MIVGQQVHEEHDIIFILDSLEETATIRNLVLDSLSFGGISVLSSDKGEKK